MKKVDVWETVAAVAMHVERERLAGNIPSSTLGAFSVASEVAHMNRQAAALHRLATERANGIRSSAQARKIERQEMNAHAALSTSATKLRITVEVEVMGYVTLTAGAFRLGSLPLKGS